MYCNVCGNNMPDGSKFCDKCGSPTKKTTISSAGTLKESTPKYASGATTVVRGDFLALKIIAVALLCSVFFVPFVDGHPYTDLLEALEYTDDLLTTLFILSIPGCAVLYTIFAFLEKKAGCIVTSTIGFIVILLWFIRLFGNEFSSLFSDYIEIGFWLILGLYFAGLIAACCVKETNYYKRYITTSPTNNKTKKCLNCGYETSAGGDSHCPLCNAKLELK